MQRGASVKCLYPFDRALKIFEVACNTEHVTVGSEEFVSEIQIIVVCVIQILVTPYLCRPVGFLIQERSHFYE